MVVVWTGFTNQAGLAKPMTNKTLHVLQCSVLATRGRDLSHQGDSHMVHLHTASLAEFPETSPEPARTEKPPKLPGTLYQTCGSNGAPPAFPRTQNNAPPFGPAPVQKQWVVDFRTSALHGWWGVEQTTSKLAIPSRRIVLMVARI